jgi:hypothetical protein
VEVGTVICTDEWKAYKNIEQYGYPLHLTVNHQHNFIDPDTGGHTQLIECLWNRLRFKIIRQARGVGNNLPHWLAEAWWRSLHTHPKRGPSKDLFEEYLKLVAHVYPL